MVKVHNLNDFIKGWFLGNFDPSLLKTQEFEVGIKKYQSGDTEQPHFHKIATEYTVIIQGRAEFNGKIYEKDEIVVVEPRDVISFKALTDLITVVVKIPGASNDKYLI